jgi:AcrR family transcriptional regulator
VSLFEPADGAGNDARSEQPGRRHLSERQAEVMERLVAAAAEEAEERPYAEISVRTIARRAGLAPATAYTYFSGKDHLLAEVLWRRVQSSPHLIDLNLALPERVADTVRTMGFATMEPSAVAVCTTALLGDGPDVSACARASAGRSAAAWRRRWATAVPTPCSTYSRSPTPAPSSVRAWGTCPSTRSRRCWRRRRPS